MLIAMAGLPGTGKSTLARRLGSELRAIVLDKDAVRGVLFPMPVLDYSAEQDDISMTSIYSASASILKTAPGRVVILDGRTFLRARQVAELSALARSVRQTLFVIECMCADEVARERLERDLAQGVHPARNRTFALYKALQAGAEPIQVPRLVVDTGVTTLEMCVQRCREYLKMESEK